MDLHRETDINVGVAMEEKVSELERGAAATATTSRAEKPVSVAVKEPAGKEMG